MAQEVIITPAPDIEKIATELIHEFHPELLECCVLYYLTTASATCAPEKPKPRVRYAYSTHVKGVVKAEVAAGPDFLVWVNDLEWADVVDDGKQRPFIDHRIEHMSREEGKDGVPRYVIKPHEFEDFTAVLQRFGAWSDQARQVRDILQPELDLGLPPAETSGTRPRTITLSTPGIEPVTLTGEQWDRVSRS